MSDELPLKFCSMCGNMHRDKRPSYCRPCTNDYMKWKYGRDKEGLDSSVSTYREVCNKPHLRPRDPEIPEGLPPELFIPLKVCNICHLSHRNPHSCYCRKCQSLYNAWRQRNLQKGIPRDQLSMAHFRMAYDNDFLDK